MWKAANLRIHGKGKKNLTFLSPNAIIAPFDEHCSVAQWQSIRLLTEGL